MFALVKNVTVTVTDLDGSNARQEDQQVIRVFAPYTIFEDKDGTQYSPDQLFTWTAQQKQDRGIYEVAYQSRPDDRFYDVTENAPIFDSTAKVVRVTYTSSAKGLDDVGEVKGLKTQSIQQVNIAANSLLSSTDWMLVRKIERNVDVPTATATYRTAVIAESNRLVDAISSATKIADLISAVNSANWPTAE